MTEAAALAKLQTLVDLSVEPELTTTEAKAALQNTKRFGDRAASASYGDRIASGSRVYQCVQEGDTAVTAPTSFGRSCYGGRITDGSAIWQDIGERPSSEWDFMAAKKSLYDLRVQRCAELVNQKDKDFSENVEALYDHWVKERSKVVLLRAV